ncbi:MAG: DUF1990 family protein [Thermoleophilaceae bacterium]
MPQTLRLSNRVATASRWPLGVALTSWRYLWRTTPLHRREEPGSWAQDAPPSLPASVSGDEVQHVGEGAGPLFHRRYRVRIAGPAMTAEELIDRLAADPDAASPSEFASFRKMAGEDGAMAVGDEYRVRMPGPWDGPVRVVARTPTAFRLATLAGHLEAGQIEFSVVRVEDDLQFTIESWARAGDRFSALLFDQLRMSKEIQLHMWTSFLERVVELAEGRRRRGLEIRTRRVDATAEGSLHDRDARSALDDLHDRPLNFDLADRDAYAAERGWNVDDQRQPLPPEPPGDPVPGGSWETACDLMRRYEFADPSIVRAVYEDDSPLEGRDMLLEIRFLGLRFHVGVRVGGVLDETRAVDGRSARVWGWYYGTLQGHLEMGQMQFEVWKWLDSGEVEFRIHAFSRPAEIRNPIVRLGFRVFGRREQLRFARHARERMARLIAEELGVATGARRAARTADELTVRPVRREAT